MNWWQTFFDRHYGQCYLHQSHPLEVDFLLRSLGLAPGSRVFDQCCGCGRVSQALGQRGLRPVGVDCQPDYVEQSRQACPGGHFSCADAREFVATPACDGGLNVYSSFGYCAEDADNQRMLECAFASLRPGARFVLDTINFARVLGDFQPLLHESFADGTSVQRRCRLNWTQGMLEQHWIYLLPDGEQVEKFGATRMLLPREVGQALTGAGFELLNLYGSAAAEAFEQSSPRLIWLAQRPC